ncbi:MAG: hypothetical protein MJ192_10205 [Clostridia bacterium]|nr:hypothetical protein [Clostridia bacterium]
MKKTFLLLLSVLALAVCLTVCLSACTDKNDPSDTEAPTATEAEASAAPTDPASEAPAGDPTEAPTDAPTEAPTDAATEPETVGENQRAGGTVKVVSYNLDANLDTVNRRSTGMCSIIQGLDPDSFGVQECRPAWLSVLEKTMKGYSHIGLSADGPNPSAGTFGTYIFYKTDKYTVVDSGTFWLSKTPDVPSMYGPTVDCNRTCCWVILEDKETGFRYVHMNSHLDWMDVKATDYQIEMIREQILRFEAMGLPVFATGDYNNDEGSETYRRMLKAEKIADAKYVAAKSMDLGTYPDYDKYDVTVEKPIDFCFVTKDRMTVKEYRVVNDKYNGNYVSDHFGLFIEAEVPPMDDLFGTADAPAFDGEITVGDVKPNRFEITFPAANDFSCAIKSYRVAVTDPNGTLVYEDEISSGCLMPTPPASFTAAVSGLLPGTAYTVKVTAVNFFVKQSEPLTVKVTTAEPTEAEAVGPADIFDLQLTDTWTDVSPAGLALQKIGTVRIEERDGQPALVFGGGNLKAPGIKDYYNTLGLGFTMELDVTVGQKTAFNSLMSNMHAGGFGFEIEGNQLDFSVYVGSYQGVAVKVAPGDRLHLVATYDGSVLTLYVNGELTDRKTVGKIKSFATDNGAKYLCLGADSDASGQGEYPTDSVIYAARIWSEPITEGQAMYLFAEARK